MELLQQRGLAIKEYLANPTNENRQKVLMANAEINREYDFN